MLIWFSIVLGISWFPVGAVSYRFGRYFASKCTLDLDKNWIWYETTVITEENFVNFTFSVILGYLSFAWVVLLYTVVAILTAMVYISRISVFVVKFLAGYKR